jgi:hypothetical protein
MEVESVLAVEVVAPVVPFIYIQFKNVKPLLGVSVKATTAPLA